MLSRQDILDAKEKYKSVYTNPLTPLNFLKRTEMVFPDRKAVVYLDKSCTWREFADRVYRLANGLKRWGIKKNDRVAMLSRNNSALLESFYGIGLAGAVSVPMNFRLVASEIAYILNHSESKVLILEHLYADAVREVRDKLETVELFIETSSFDKTDGETLGVSYEDFLRDSSPEAVDVPVEDENDMLSIVYTSGTTGLPKGCVHTHRGAYLNALGEVIEARLDPDSSYLWTLPMFHCQGWCFVWAVTAVGATHVCLDAVRAETMHQLMTRENVTHMCGAPQVYATLSGYMKEKNLRFPRKVRGIMGGAPPSFKNIRDAEAVNIDLQQVYGLSEVYGPHTTCEWNSEWDKLSLPERANIKVRQGVPYVTYTFVKVVDEDMNEVPRDGETSGEVVMRGNNVMQWYFNDAEKTEESFRGGWFHSGDAAVVHPSGYIEIVDRIKDIVVTGGEKVSSIEVENAIMEHPAVADVAVVGKPDEKWYEIVKAIVQVKPGATLTRDELTQWCRTRLGGFKIPREIEFGEVPRTSTGKIMKHVLKKRERKDAKVA